MRTHKTWARTLRYLAALSSGMMLLQSSGCTLDQTLLNDLLNATLQVFVDSLVAT
jgi:hypothetical protein